MSELKSQKVNENIESEIHKIFLEFPQLQYIQKDEIDEIINQKNLIIKCFCYGQQNINNLTILKESNIDEFKKLLNSQINVINSNLKYKLNKKVNNIISLLDKLFNDDFSKKENNIGDINKIKKFKKDISTNKLKIIEEFNINQKKILDIFKKSINDMNISLNEKKKNLENYLEVYSVEKIKKQIEYLLENQVIDLNEQIDDYLCESFKKINELFKEAGEKIEI